MVGWILAGYALPLMAGLVLAKLRRILVQHTAPLLADAERRGQRGSLKAITNRSIRRRHAQEERSFKKKGAKSPPRSPERRPPPREKVLVHDTYHHAFLASVRIKSRSSPWMCCDLCLLAAIYIAILLLVHAPALLKGEVLADYSIYVRLIVFRNRVATAGILHDLRERGR